MTDGTAINVEPPRGVVDGLGAIAVLAWRLTPARALHCQGFDVRIARAGDQLVGHR